MFFISNTQQNLLIENCLFSENIVKVQLINALTLLNHTIQNTICHLTNSLVMANYQYLGGCFRSSNVIQRLYSNVTISNCYSDFTTVGIKIIDLLENSAKNETKVKDFINIFIYLFEKNELINCLFLNNFVNFQRLQKETAVSLYLDSDATILIQNSTFMVKNHQKFFIF